MKRNIFNLFFVVFILLTSCTSIVEDEIYSISSDEVVNLAKEYGLSVTIDKPFLQTRSDDYSIENEFKEISLLLGTHEFNCNSDGEASTVVCGDSLSFLPLRIIPGGSSVEDNSLIHYTRYYNYYMKITFNYDFSTHNDYSISASIHSGSDNDRSTMDRLNTTLCGEGNGTLEFNFYLYYTKGYLLYSFFVSGHYDFDDRRGDFSVSSTLPYDLDGGFF